VYLNEERLRRMLQVCQLEPLLFEDSKLIFAFLSSGLDSSKYTLSDLEEPDTEVYLGVNHTTVTVPAYPACRFPVPNW
jgi:hypothetical protein